MGLRGHQQCGAAQRLLLLPLLPSRQRPAAPAQPCIAHSSPLLVPTPCSRFTSTFCSEKASCRLCEVSHFLIESSVLSTAPTSARWQRGVLQQHAALTPPGHRRAATFGLHPEFRRFRSSSVSSHCCSAEKLRCRQKGEVSICLSGD